MTKKQILIISIAFLMGVCVSFLGYLVIHQYKIKMNAAKQSVVQTGSGQTDEAGEKEYIDTIFRELDTSVHEAVPGIVCWGDSLTAGAGGDGITYEATLHDLIQENILSQFSWDKFVDDSYTYLLDSVPEGYGQSYSVLPDIPVINMGAGGEGTTTIMGRAGAVPFVVAEDIVIPARSFHMVEIEIQGQNGGREMPMCQGDAGMQSVTIAGVKGYIKTCQEPYASPEYTYYFFRETTGEEVPVEAGTVIYTEGSEAYTDYLPVIFMGQNGGLG